MKNFIARGLVYGKNWGGGFGAYASREIREKTKAGLLVRAKADLKSGALDSGMGFEFLAGALLDIEEIETIKIKGKEFKRSEFKSIFIGDLTEKEQNFLLECNY